MTGRTNPLPGLTGLGGAALPGLISPSSSPAPLAGIVTNGRWDSANKSPNLTVTNAGRTITPNASAAGGIKGTLDFLSTSASGTYFEQKVVDFGSNASNYFFVGVASAATSVTAYLSGGDGGTARNFYTSPYQCIETNYSTVGTVARAGYGVLYTPTSSVIQVFVANGYVWIGAGGSLSGLTAAQIASGAQATFSGLTGRVFPYSWLDGTTSPDPIIEFNVTTAFAAPVGAAVY